MGTEANKPEGEAKKEGGAGSEVEKQLAEKDKMIKELKVGGRLAPV